MRTTALLATALLAITLILVFATAASAGRDRAMSGSPATTTRIGR